MPGFETAFRGIADAVQSVFASLMNHVIIAAVILLVGFLAGRIIGNLVMQLLHEIGLDVLTKRTGIGVSFEKLLGIIITYGIYFLALVMALNVLGLDSFVLNVLAYAIIATLLVSVLLSVKDFLPNIFAGFFIHRKGMIREGDKVHVDGMAAKVVKTDVMEVKLQTDKGDTIFVPNSLFVKRKLIRRRR
jgi:small-conductance mechanosensitive channel